MHDSLSELDQLALALVHWLEAHVQVDDPVARSRALDEACRRLGLYLPAPVTQPRRRQPWWVSLRLAGARLGLACSSGGRWAFLPHPGPRESDSV